MNRIRRILIRWDKKPENYLALLHFACVLIAFRAAGLCGLALGGVEGSGMRSANKFNVTRSVAWAIIAVASVD